MPLRPYACANCGHWQRHFAVPPACPVCSDVRNDLPDEGWDFRTPEELAPALTWHWREPQPGVHEVWTTPRFGLDSHGWIIEHEAGNVSFEAAPLYDDAALDGIARRGGLAMIASSHPHGYGALWQLQERFNAPVLVQREDLQWTKAFRVTHPYDDVLEIADGLTLHHTGGHYDGHAVLYDARRRALFAGDALKIDLDPSGRAAGISCHKAYHKQIPLTRDEARRYRDVISRLDFTSVYTPFECAPDVTTADAVALLDAVIAGPPFTTQCQSNIRELGHEPPLRLQYQRLHQTPSR